MWCVNRVAKKLCTKQEVLGLMSLKCEVHFFFVLYRHLVLGAGTGTIVLNSYPRTMKKIEVKLCIENQTWFLLCPQLLRIGHDWFSSSKIWAYQNMSIPIFSCQKSGTQTLSHYIQTKWVSKFCRHALISAWYVLESIEEMEMKAVHGP